MKRKMFALFICLFAVCTLAAPAVRAVNPSMLQFVDNKQSAIAVFLDELESVSNSEAVSGERLDELAQFAEELIRQSSATAETLESAVDEVRQTTLAIESRMQSANVYFIRALKIGILLKSSDPKLLKISIGNANFSDIDRVTMQSGFASVTIPANNARLLDKISVKPIGISKKETTSAFAILGRYWSILAIAVIVLAWLFIMVYRKKRVSWWLPVAICVIFVAVNLFTAPIPGNKADTENFEYKPIVSVSMEENIAVTLSIPVGTLSHPEELIMFDDSGNALVSQYNSFTKTVDATINESGEYSLDISPVYLTDIADKSEETQKAIRELVSRGVMASSGERQFSPNRQITRAEFTDTLLSAVGLLDENATSKFTDVIKSDWYYAAAASAEKLNLISGYGDGKFHGNDPIPKDQMTVLTARIMERVMGYTTPANAEQILSEYTDFWTIQDWAKDGIAIATRAGIVPAREDGAFAPDSVMTRGEAAVMMYRLFGKIR